MSGSQVYCSTATKRKGFILLAAASSNRDKSNGDSSHFPDSLWDISWFSALRNIWKYIWENCVWRLTKEWMDSESAEWTFFMIRTQALLKELKVILDGQFVVVAAECLLCGAVLVSAIQQDALVMIVCAAPLRTFLFWKTSWIQKRKCNRYKDSFHTIIKKKNQGYPE